MTLQSINARTGTFFTEAELARGEDLIQAIRDRVFTVLGSRELHDEYGTIAAFGVYPLDSVGESIRTSLLGDARITSVDYFVEGRNLQVDVNGVIRMTL